MYVIEATWPSHGLLLRAYRMLTTLGCLRCNTNAMHYSECPSPLLAAPPSTHRVPGYPRRMREFNDSTVQFEPVPTAGLKAVYQCQLPMTGCTSSHVHSNLLGRHHVPQETLTPCSPQAHTLSIPPSRQRPPLSHSLPPRPSLSHSSPLTRRCRRSTNSIENPKPTKTNPTNPTKLYCCGPGIPRSPQSPL